MVERGEGKAGVMHTFSNTAVDLLNFTADMVVKEDITQALSKNIRFNGHITNNFTVYEHSMIGAAWAESPRHKLEALLHDTGEAYTGDIILPMKECFPEIAEFEDKITAVIFDKLWPGNGLTAGGVYKKSPYMVQLDRDMAGCESYHFRPTHAFTQRTYEKQSEWYKLYLDLENKLLNSELCDPEYPHGLFWRMYNKLLEEVNG